MAENNSQKSTPNYTQINAKSFYNTVKDKTAVFLSGNPIDNGNIEITPKVIRNALTGRAFRGANQINAQQMQKKAGKAVVEIATYDQIKSAGSAVKKDQPVMYLSLQKDNQWTQAAYYFKDAAVEPEKLTLAKTKFKSETNLNISRQKLTSEIDQDKKEALEKRIANEHKVQIMCLLREQELSMGADEFANLDKSKVIISYLKAVPENEKKSFTEKILKDQYFPNTVNGKKIDELAASYGPGYFQEREPKDIGKIDATNTVSPREYLGKYLAASQIGAKFITDQQSIDAVQKALEEEISKGFEKKDYLCVNKICSEASEVCVDTLKSFRGMSYEQQHTIESERKREEPRSYEQEQSIEANMF